MLADGAKMKSTKKEDGKDKSGGEKPHKMTGKELRDYFNNRRSQMKR